MAIRDQIFKGKKNPKMQHPAKDNTIRLEKLPTIKIYLPFESNHRR